MLEVCCLPALPNDPPGDREFMADDGESAGHGFEQDDSEGFTEGCVDKHIGAAVHGSHFRAGQRGADMDSGAKQTPGEFLHGPVFSGGGIANEQQLGTDPGRDSREFLDDVVKPLGTARGKVADGQGKCPVRWSGLQDALALGLATGRGLELGGVDEVRDHPPPPGVPTRSPSGIEVLGSEDLNVIKAPIPVGTEHQAIHVEHGRTRIAKGIPGPPRDLRVRQVDDIRAAGSEASEEGQGEELLLDEVTVSWVEETEEDGRAAEGWDDGSGSGGGNGPCGVEVDGSPLLVKRLSEVRRPGLRPAPDPAQTGNRNRYRRRHGFWMDRADGGIWRRIIPFGESGASGEGPGRGCAARSLNPRAFTGEDELDEWREAPADFD